MRKLTFWSFACLFVISCKQRQTLTQQLTNAFSTHLKQIDSAAVLDSLHILWSVPATPRLGRIIDDSIYSREYSRIKMQLANVQQNNYKDSIEFYQYEISYMEKEIDSISKGIVHSDTTHRYGTLFGCAYYIKKNDKTKIDSTILFVDSTSTIHFNEYMDSAIHRSIKTLD
ncbi:MAG TPA: hypothetical protein VMH01_10380 [Puia sp.]|nr:hypothetical protein [Puia sp.]